MNAVIIIEGDSRGVVNNMICKACHGSGNVVLRAGPGSKVFGHFLCAGCAGNRCIPACVTCGAVQFKTPLGSPCIYCSKKKDSGK